MTSKTISNKNISVPYNNNVIQWSLPVNINYRVVRPKEYKKNYDWQNKLQDIFISSEWNEFIKTTILQPNKSMLLVINDATRSTPTAFLLNKLIPIFEDNHMNLKIIIATGSHKNPTTEDLEGILGQYFLKYSKSIIIHDAYNSKTLTKIGNSSFGTPIYVNKILLNKNISCILTINSIEPHYFAGWTGGRKSIIPGIAGLETIAATHKHTLNPESQTCRLSDNPVHEDLEECFQKTMRVINIPISGFQFVIDSQQTIHEIFFGQLTQAFEKGVKFASKIFQVPIKEKYDAVISVLYPPFDKTFYQAHKGIEHGKLALKQNGDLLLIASCTEGIGPRKFMEPLKVSQKIYPDEILKEIRDNYKLGYHKAAKLVENATNFQMWIYSKLSKETAQILLFKSITNIQQWVNDLIMKKDMKSILILLDAGITVPMYQ